MNYLTCCFRYFNCNEYKEPIFIELEDRGEFDFYLMHKEMGTITQVINSHKFLERFGENDARKLLDNYTCVAFIEGAIDDMLKARLLLNIFFNTMQFFSTALWFIRDNSVIPYYVTFSSDNIIEPEMLRRSVYYSNSRGNYETQSYNKDEIDKAMNWYSILKKHANVIPKSRLDLESSLTNLYRQASLNTPSFNRALMYLDSSRKSEFLPSKIALYITILELLFAVKGENTDKVAERTAVFVGEDNSSKSRIYKDVVAAYDIRSSYVHGSEIRSSKQEILPTTSETLDSIVREVLSKLLTEHHDLNYINKKSKDNPDAKNAEDVNEWFNQLVLGN